MRYLFSLAAGLVACFALQALALRASGNRVRKGESNYFSSLARIQDATRGAPRVMLLGSSRTGRLPDRSQGVEGVANLGCDGASAVVVLRALASGHLRPAPILLVEGNTLHKAATEPDPGLGRAIGSPWFQIGCRLRPLSAMARPSAMLYGVLLGQIHGRGGLPARAPQALTRPVRLDPAERIDLSVAEERLVVELASLLEELRASGVRVLIHDLPPPAPRDSPNVRVSYELARRTGTETWDLSDAFPPGSLGYTDGVHLDSPSAGKVLAILIEDLEGR